MIGNPDFTLALDEGPAGAQAILLLDLAPGALQVLGLPVNLGLTAALVALPLGRLQAAGPVGWTSLTTPLPADPALHGGSIYAQALVADPVAPAGASATAGLRVTLFSPR